VYAPCKVPGPANTDEWEVPGTNARRPRPLKYNGARQCQLNITLTKRLEKTTDFRKYIVFYRLTKFYQNHQIYAGSYSFDQLLGRHLPKTTFSDPESVLATRCDIPPGRNVTQRTNSYFPCGFISRSFFDDVITLASDTSMRLEMNDTDISWAADRERFKKVTYSEESDTDYLFERYPGIVAKNEGVTNEHFSVWFRVEFYPNFIKRYGKLLVPQDLEKYQTIKFDVSSAFEVASFGGTKSIVIKSSTPFGANLTQMGHVFIILGVVSLFEALGVLIFMIWRQRKRRSSVFIET